MKNIEQILKDAGVDLTDEQKEAVNKGVTENYRTINDYNTQKKKLDDSESALETANKQLADAQETLKGFDGVDVEGFQKKIADLEERANKAEKDAAAKILQRDQRDYLNAEFERLGITSERTRKSLMADIMGEDGLKWKDGTFLGLSDYLAKENEKDHFYQTEDEKKAEADKAAEEEAKQKAAGGAPKWTSQSEGKPANGDNKPTFNFGFTPIREVKKGD